MYGVSNMAEIDNKLWLLGNSITDSCYVLDPVTNLVGLDGACVLDYFNRLSIDRKLTIDECDYLAMRVFAVFSMSPAQYDDIKNQIVGLLGQKDTPNPPSILSLINVGLIGIFAFIGYKIISRKK